MFAARLEETETKAHRQAFAQRPRDRHPHSAQISHRARPSPIPRLAAHPCGPSGLRPGESCSNPKSCRA
jgi:hypothetical protein